MVNHSVLEQQFWLHWKCRRAVGLLVAVWLITVDAASSLMDID